MGSQKNKTKRILILESSPQDYDLIKKAVEQGGIQSVFERVDSLSDLKHVLTREIHVSSSLDLAWDVLIVDYNHPELASSQTQIPKVFQLLKDEDLIIPTIFISNTPGEELAIDCLKMGASDYILKNNLSRLAPSIMREIEAFRHIRTDIADRQRLENKLIENQREEAISEFAGGIAHEFNNILTAILGFSQIVLKELKPGTKSHSNIHSVILAARRARGVVRQILDLSKPHDNRPTVFSVVDLINEVSTFLKATIPPRIKLQVPTQPLSAWVMADSFQIQQVLMKLCARALQAIGSDVGHIHIDCSLEKFNATEAQQMSRAGFVLGEVEEGEYVRIEIKDDGRSIAADELPLLFEPSFGKINPTDTTGLGLMVTQRVVRSNSGILVVSSEEKKGTTFTIYLPSKQKHERALQEVSSLQYKVLVVDDEEVLCNVLKQMLEFLGHTVSTCADPVEALVMIKKENFDLCITDQTMPEMSGTELASKLHVLQPQLKCILISGFGHEQNSISTNHDFSGVIRKPFSLEELDQTIRSALL